MLRRLAVVSVAALILAVPADASIRSRIQTAFGPRHDATALCIARVESGFNPLAISPTDDHGLFQIHRGLETYGRRIYNVAFNIRIAYRMSHGGRNWGPWTGTYGQGLCHHLS